MFFQLMLTTECNLKCRYCYGEALEDVDADFPDFEIDYCLPKRISYDVDSLDRFCRQHPDCVLTFYGGEPYYFALMKLSNSWIKWRLSIS